MDEFEQTLSDFHGLVLLAILFISFMQTKLQVPKGVENFRIKYAVFFLNDYSSRICQNRVDN